jgi:hypothetical protein
MPKVLIIAGVSVLALALVLGLALPALAAPPGAEDSQIEVVKGKVLTIGDQEFVIQSGEQELTISVDENTKYFKLCVPGRIIALARQQRVLKPQDQLPPLEEVNIPKLPRVMLNLLRHFGEGAEFGDIAQGDRVVVWLADGDNLAKRVLIIEPTIYARLSGTITDISSSAITITTDDGEAVILDCNESTVFVLDGITQVEEGQYALAVYDSDNMVAKKVVVHQETS